MTGIRVVAAKVAAFAVASGLLLVLLLNTMANGIGGDTREFSAEFADVNGLAIGDDVKAAGVRVGRVTGIDVTDDGAEVRFELVDEQPLLSNTGIVMRYQNLLGQRYLALVQPDDERRGTPLDAEARIPLERTDPGFDLTELLNGFRPLFAVLEPKDVNTLATSIVQVLQGEGGTVESLLRQTAEVTDFVADRDDLIDRVMTRLQPVLDNLAGQGDELSATVVELRDLMTGLARDRRAIGSSIDGIAQLVGSTSSLLREARAPLTGTSRELRETAAMLADSRSDLEDALPAFGLIFESLGRVTSYESALNVYVCSFRIRIGPSLRINPNGKDGPWSEVCR